MLTVNNPTDVEVMRKYRRTSDMLDLSLYFPQLSPVRNLTIIESVEDYWQHYEIVKNYFFKRCDNLIGRKLINLETVGGVEENIPLLNEIKEIDKNGVLVMFQLDSSNVRRYEYDGGMAVSVDVGDKITIESVGKGFDGREVSKGITCHERYLISWDDLGALSLDTLARYRIYLVASFKYEIDRKERIDYLLSKGAKEEDFLACIPTEYQQLHPLIWRMLFLNMLKELPKMEEEFHSAGINNFAVSGNIVNREFAPWQMYNQNRFGKPSSYQKKLI